MTKHHYRSMTISGIITILNIMLKEQTMSGNTLRRVYEDVNEANLDIMTKHNKGYTINMETTLANGAILIIYNIVNKGLAGTWAFA